MAAYLKRNKLGKYNEEEMADLIRVHPDRVLIVTERTEQPGDGQRRFHFPMAFDRQLYGPMCSKCKNEHLQKGCEPHQWRKSEHQPPPRAAWQIPVPMSRTELQAAMLVLQKKIGLSEYTILPEYVDPDSARRGILRCYNNDRDLPPNEWALRAEVSAFLEDYRSLYIRYRRAEITRMSE